MGWLGTIKEALSAPTVETRPPDAGYEVIAGDEHDELVLSTGSLPPRIQDDKRVYQAFWVLGAGVLLSWNALICTFPFMATFFAEGSSTRTNLASYLSTVFCFGNVICLGIAQRDVGSTPPTQRLHLALILLLGSSILLTCPVLPILPHLSSSSPFILPLLVVVTLMLSISTAYLQSAVFALASLWGSKEVLAVMSGQGGIAVLVSLVQLVLAIISALGTNAVEDDGPGSQSVIAAVGLWALASLAAMGCMMAHRYLRRHSDYAMAIAPVLARRERQTDGSKVGGDSGMSMAIFRKNLSLEVAVAWVFVSVFPPITTTIVSTRVPPPRLLQPAIFIPIHFFIFNVGDYIGRTYLPSIPILLATAPKRILALSLSRTLYIPLFLACNVNPASTPIIDSDTIYFLILASFGMTNGYISSLSMIVASSPELNPSISDSEKDVAGTLAAFCLVAGLAGGSVLSFGVNYLVRGNPFA